jgi:hypothetical protein
MRGCRVVRDFVLRRERATPSRDIFGPRDQVWAVIRESNVAQVTHASKDFFIFLFLKIYDPDKIVKNAPQTPSHAAIAI